MHASASTGANDGSSWSDAYRGPLGLQAALAAAQPGDEIWVAMGTYLPAGNGDRSQSFLLKPGITIRGGFAGWETQALEALPRFQPSVLSGDLAQDDDGGAFTDNSLVVLKSGTADSSTLVHGLVITAATDCAYTSTATSPWLNNCWFEGNHAGAVRITSGAPARFEACRFSRNRSNQAPILDFQAAGPVELVNCIVVQNELEGPASAAILAGSAPLTLLQLTIADNHSTNPAFRAVAGTTATLVLNSILWRNSISDLSGGDARACCVGIGPLGARSFRADPMFLDAVRGDYRLSPVSPCVDRADGDALPSSIQQDIDGLPRLVDQYGMPELGSGSVAFVDLGAHESALSSHTPICAGDGTQFMPCPCASGALGRGCANSNPGSIGALINATGDTQPDTLGLHVTGLPDGSLCIFLSGSNGGIGSAFGGGVLCSEGIVRRLYIRSAREGAASVPDLHAGEPQFGVRSALAGDPIQPGQIRYYQAWYRDPVVGFCPQGAAFNVTSGVLVHW